MNLIKLPFEEKLFSHIKNKMEKDFNCLVKCINGIEDHIHILFQLDPGYSLSELVKNIKGESSYWVNNSNFINNKFLWQTGYGAFSVSESKLKEIQDYILKQKEHHRKMSFKDEYELFMKKYGLAIINR